MKETIPTESQHELPPHIFEVETKRAKYYIVLGDHSQPADIPEYLLKELDAIAIERWFDKPLPEKWRDDREGFLKEMESIEGHTQYGELMKNARSRGLPICFPDGAGLEIDRVIKGYGDERGSNTLKSVSFGAATLIAFAVAAVGGAEGHNKLISRRQFLAKTGGGVLAGTFGACASAFFGAHHLEPKDLFETPPSESDIASLEKYMDFMEKYHPEIYNEIVTLRNILMAIKLRSFAEHPLFQKRFKGEKPNVALFVGNNHINIKDSLGYTGAELMTQVKQHSESFPFKTESLDLDEPTSGYVQYHPEHGWIYRPLNWNTTTQSI